MGARGGSARGRGGWGSSSPGSPAHSANAQVTRELSVCGYGGLPIGLFGICFTCLYSVLVFFLGIRDTEQKKEQGT